MLTPYQFASNNPIFMIDLDGLEGKNYREITYNAQTGETQVKRVLEVDIHIGISAKNNNTHFKAADVAQIQADYNAEYNSNTFFDKEGNTVEFRFNFSTFDVDLYDAADYGKTLREDISNTIVSKESYMLKNGKPYLDSKTGLPMMKKNLTDVVVVKENPPVGLIPGQAVQGQTINNVNYISPTAFEPSHTRAHELAHFLIRQSPRNPTNIPDHNTMGGIFSTGGRDTNGNVTVPTQPLNQNNVNEMLEFIPESDDKHIITE